MPELPRQDFVLLSPPDGGFADARRRGRARRLRRAYAVSGAGLAAAVTVTLGRATRAPTASDRLDQAPFGRDVVPAPATPPPMPSPAAGSSPGSATLAVPAPAVRPATDAPAPLQPTAPQPVATRRSATRAGEDRVAAPTPISRSYRPPAEGQLRLCGSRADVGPTGPPKTTTADWCQTLVAEPVPGGHRLELSVCRSSNTEPAALTVDPRRPLALRVRQGNSDRWRLPSTATAGVQEDLATGPGGCWVWEYRWDGTDSAGRALEPGRYTALGKSLAEQVEALPEDSTELDVE